MSITLTLQGTRASSTRPWASKQAELHEKLENSGEDDKRVAQRSESHMILHSYNDSRPGIAEPHEQ
jgi:hypothetical protein